MEIEKLTSRELEILLILWKYGSTTVITINEEQNKIDDAGYTSTLKIMQLMSDKGILSKELNPSCAFLGNFIFFSCNFQPFRAFLKHNYLIIRYRLFKKRFVVHKGVLVFSELDVSFVPCILK